MKIRRFFQEIIGRLKSFDVWDEGHDRAPIIPRTLVTFARFVPITIREFLDDRLLLKGMALTFASILSLVPLMVILFSFFKLFGGGEWFQEVVTPFIMTNLAPGSGSVVALRLQEFISNEGSVALGGIGVLILLFAVYGIFAGIESVVNGVWGVAARVRGVRRLPLYWGLLTIIPILVVGSLAISTYIQTLPLIHEAVERISFARSVMSRLLPWLMVVTGFYLMYRYLPNTRVRGRAAAAGAIIAGLLYELIKQWFIFYTGRLVHYDVIYGSLAILPLLMIWINISWFVVLLGVETCYVTQHFHVLLTKRKHVPFSRRQKDALGYLILLEATSAFRGKRTHVTLYEWSRVYGVPPAITESVVQRLSRGGLVERTGSGGGKVLLALDPDRIRISDVEAVLSGETVEEWHWPDSKPWNWLKDWIEHRREQSYEAAGCLTLGELLDQLETDLYAAKTNPAFNGERNRGHDVE